MVVLIRTVVKFGALMVIVKVAVVIKEDTPHPKSEQVQQERGPFLEKSCFRQEATTNDYFFSEAASQLEANTSSTLTTIRYRLP